MTFHAWLLAQGQRNDDVGRLAVLANADRQFPKKAQRLYVLLRYASTSELRKAIKLAHGEWRQVRDGKAA